MSNDEKILGILEQMQGSINQINGRLDRLEAGQEKLEAGQERMNGRLDRLEAGQERIEKSMAENFREAGSKLAEGIELVEKRIDNLQELVRSQRVETAQNTFDIAQLRKNA